MLADDLAVFIFADDLIQEQILGDDDIALHPGHFGNMGDATGAIAQSRGLDDDIDRSVNQFVASIAVFSDEKDYVGERTASLEDQDPGMQITLPPV